MKNKVSKVIHKKIFPILIIIAAVFMSVGYASVSSISLNMFGQAIAKEYDGVYITNISCYKNQNYTNDLCNKKDITSVNQTIMESDITLDNNINSTITYKITVHNDTNYMHYFDQVLYILGEDTYSNENITFELLTEDNSSLFNKNTELPPNSSISFNIVFKYKENADISKNNLLSYLNFKFNRIHTITFDPNGGIVNLTNKTVIYNEKYGDLPTPTRTDFIFDGWYTDKTNGEQITKDSIVNTDSSNQTLYAHWSLPKYTITYKMNDGLTNPGNPSTYDRASSITLNNPTISKMGYRIEWTESISTPNWKNGFINITTGAYEELNPTYPNAVISEKIFLQAGVTYTISGVNPGENRWRFFNTSGEYIKNSQSTSFTPTVDGYVIVLLHNGATESVRNNIKITSSQGNTVNIKQGSTGNRTYTADIVATKIVIADIFNRDEVTVIGNTPKVNSDGSVSFDSSKKFSNILVKLPEGDYSKGITMALDVYLQIADSYNGDHNDVQSLLMARTTTDNSVFLFQWQSKVHWDLGDASDYRNTLDKDLTKTGRYLFLISYSSASGKAKKTIIIDKKSGNIIYNKTDNYSFSSLNDGISSTNYELQIGGDYYQTNGYPYDAEPQTKFYSYFFDNVGMSNDELESLIKEFGYGTFEIS